jgi:hypothetical protein
VPPQNISGLTRIGIWALPLAGLLSLIGGLASLGSPDPGVDPRGAAQAASSSGFVLSQFVGNVLAVTLAIFGVIALFAYLANIGWGRLAAAAMILCILGFAMLLSFLGLPTYVIPVISRTYLSGQHDAFRVVGAIFDSVFPIIIVASLLYFLGFLIFSVVIWRSGVLPRGAGVLLAIAGLVLAVPAPSEILTIVGSVLLLVAGGWIALSVMRGPSGPSEAAAQPRVR